MKNILEVKNLSYTYSGENAEALHDLSFSVPAGSYVAIVGHNGSGKSTLAKIIAGLCSYKKGTVTLFGEKLNKENLPALRQKMGLVFQNPDNQFVGSSVRDDIAFGLENRQESRNTRERSRWSNISITLQRIFPAVKNKGSPSLVFLP